MLSKSCVPATIGGSRTSFWRMYARLLLSGVAVAVALTSIGLPAASACNTPVYRYAMYNWQTAPYIVFYFYEGEVPEEDKALHDQIAKLTEEWPPEANVRLEPIDVSDKKKMDTLPQFVIDAWKTYEDGKLPAHVIFAPWRANVYSGHLDGDSVEKLIDSPARQKFGELLGEGNAAVMILLTCGDEEQDKKAEQALKGLQKMADSGEIPVEIALPPMGLPGDEGEEASADEPDPNKLGIAVLKVDRDDPAEKFLVRMLMSIEDDLEEYADQPMIFAGYGRGRAMEPYIGKGITTENLVDVVAFLAGACSCMVKEQNPGADLLVKWNWEATADKMAENDPSLDAGPYGPYGYGEIPADPEAATTPEEEVESGVSADDGAPGQAESESANDLEETVAVELAAASETAAASGELPAAGPSDATETSGDVSEPPSAIAESETPAEAVPHTTSATTSAHGSPAAEYAGSVHRRMIVYGLGFGAIAVGIVLAGLALIVRRS